MPEKGTSEIARPVREQYEKGVAAIHRDNLDYALTILTSVLAQEPALYPAREALRDAQFRRAAKKGGFFRKVFGVASHSPLLAKAQIELRTNPRQALQTAEQILNSDANSVAAHKIVAAAATALDLPKTALFSLQFAFKNAPEREIALQLSRALAQAGQVTKADAVLTDLAKTFPNDQEIAQALKDLAAKRTLSEGGYDALGTGQGSYRDILKDKAEAVSLEQEKREVKTADVASRLLEEHEARLAQEPRNTRVLRAMAELHLQQRAYDQALEVFQQIVEIEGAAEPSLHRAITQTTLRRFDEQIAALDPDAPDHETTLRELQADRDAYELERMHNLVDQYPNDLALRFDLGKTLFDHHRITEAIQEFQKAQNNPHKKVPSLFYLGQCFAHRGVRDVAVRSLESALREKTLFDDEKKEILYALAGVLETMGRKDEAMDRLKLIYEVDIGYKDVAARVDAFYANGSGT